MTDKDNEPDAAAHDAESARIAKVIARAGLASRREAEAWIEAGRVAINGQTITSPAVNVGPRDRITVDGAPLPARERTRLWLYHKPRGLVTTAKDPEGRTTVFDVLPTDLPRVVSVGRLDLNTEGLLLLTNDGGLARVLAHPSTAWLRRYRVRAFGKIDLAALERLKDGIEIEGFSYGPIEATLDRQQGDNAWLTLGLREGKNREVRKVLEHLGLMVNRLLRVSFGPFQLGELPEGEAEEVRTRYLRDQLGSLADEAECDFSAPIVDRTPKPDARRKRGEATADAPRRRAGLTTDRKGRQVLVERVETEKKPEPPRRRGRDDRPRERFDERPARAGRPERPQRDDRRGPPRRDGDSPRPFRAREERGDRPQRDDRRGPPRDRAHADRPGRPPRRDGDAPRPFRSREDRPFRDERRGPPRDRARPAREGDAPRPFRKREDRPERPQEPRPDGNRPRVFRARPERPEREERRGPPRDRARGDRPDRPPRREGDDRRGPPRDRDSRPPRRDGAKPRGFGGKPGGKPGGRPSGSGRPSGPPRGRPGGGRPGGGRPRTPR